MSFTEQKTLRYPEREFESGISCDRILIAEDDAMSRKILRSWLEDWGYEVTVAEDGAAAWKVLQQEQPPELLILDWIMPMIDGMELCRRIRGRQQGSYPYILLATSRDEKQDIVKGLDAGADDYLTKPLDRNELQARLRVGKRILTLQRGLIQTREELRFQATHDALTGILNRGTILDLLHRELERAIRSKSATGVLMLDLDHFKLVNDTYGHLAGDVVLKEVARRMSQAVRAYDLVARYGGEEFLIVLPGCDTDQLQECAERIRSSIAGAPVIAASELSITASIGAVVARLDMATEMEILAAADLALYEAKRSGRNRAVLSNAGQ
jgi:diguanylate cyclase (GGDEF)-like protein